MGRPAGGEQGCCCDFRFVFVLFLNLGGCGLMGVGRFFFFFKLLPQLFQAANI